ncbi:hypothetical protein, partial [Bacillus mycoides]|uniref:hypothetical protein n=1 Tax=Bacillus mycoides TaxID=1405 RepID=UPI003A7FBB2E
EERISNEYAGVDKSAAIRALQQAYRESSSFVDSYMELWGDGKKLRTYRVSGLDYEETPDMELMPGFENVEFDVDEEVESFLQEVKEDE